MYFYLFVLCHVIYVFILKCSLCSFTKPPPPFSRTALLIQQVHSVSGIIHILINDPLDFWTFWPMNLRTNWPFPFSKSGYNMVENKLLIVTFSMQFRMSIPWNITYNKTKCTFYCLTRVNDIFSFRNHKIASASLCQRCRVE